MDDLNVVGSSDMSDWGRGIEQSDVFLVLGTPDYFRDARAWAQTLYAKELKKPFRILLKRGTDLPKDFLEGVNDYQIMEWSTTAELQAAAVKILKI